MRLEAEESKWETCTYFPSPTSGGAPAANSHMPPTPVLTAPIPGNPVKSP